MLSGTFYTPDGQFIAAWTADDIRTEGVSPGGWSRAVGTVQVHTPYLGMNEALPGSMVEIHDEYGLSWRGRLESPGSKLSPERSYMQVTAYGYSANLADQLYHISKVFRAGSTVDGIMAQTRNDLCPQISTNNRHITPTNRVLATDTIDFINRRPIDVFRALAALGDANDNPIYWHVWEGPPNPGSKAELEITTRPTVPAYYTSIAEGTSTEVETPLSEMWNVAVIKWGNPAQYAIVQDYASQSLPPRGYGVVREFPIDATHLTSQSDAEKVGRTFLSYMKRVRPRGKTITIPKHTDIRDAAGERVPPTRVRPGKLIQITDLRPSAIMLGQYVYFIAGTAYNDRDGTLSLTPETPDYLTRILSRFASGTSGTLIGA